MNKILHYLALSIYCLLSSLPSPHSPIALSITNFMAFPVFWNIISFSMWTLFCFCYSSAFPSKMHRAYFLSLFSHDFSCSFTNQWNRSHHLSRILLPSEVCSALPVSSVCPDCIAIWSKTSLCVQVCLCVWIYMCVCMYACMLSECQSTGKKNFICFTFPLYPYLLG